MTLLELSARTDKHIAFSNTKVLFIDHFRWQNFRPSLSRLVNNCVESIYKTQKTKKKVLPSVTVG
mgnify:CR=1 FL=1